MTANYKQGTEFALKYRQEYIFKVFAPCFLITLLVLFSPEQGGAGAKQNSVPVSLSVPVSDIGPAMCVRTEEQCLRGPGHTCI